MRRLILSAAFGGHERIAALTGKTLKAYAERIGADLRVMSGDFLRGMFPSPHWAKTAVGLALTGGGYDEVAWIDSDAIISPSAPNIFDIADGNFAAFPESTKLDRLDNFKEYVRIIHGQDIDPQVYFNSGVMVIPRSAAAVVSRPPDVKLHKTIALRRDHPEKFFHDQDWINSMIVLNKIETQSLPLNYNWMPFEDEWDRWHEAAIIHYAGRWNIHKEKLIEIIKCDLRKWGVEPCQRTHLT